MTSSGIHGLSTITMYLEPTDRLQPGSTVVISCAVDTDATDHTLLWLRRRGDETSRLASGEVFDKYLQTSRYDMTVTRGPRWHNYTMTIDSKSTWGSFMRSTDRWCFKTSRLSIACFKYNLHINQRGHRSRSGQQGSHVFQGETASHWVFHRFVVPSVQL